MNERIEKLNSMLKDSPDDEFLQHALALEWIKLGEDEKAKTLFENILKKNPAYTGSYYHLAKLLERSGNIAGALEIYEKGVSECRKAGDKHAESELRMAWDDLLDE